MDATATIAIIGGTGLETAFDALGDPVEVATPYGSTSAPVRIGSLAGRDVAFLPRHGAAHSLPPAAIPARANIWALARLGVRAIVSSAAVGSLDPRLGPPSFVLPDQLIDRTRTRRDTFFDGDPRFLGAGVEHLPFADPFCPTLREVAQRALPDAAPTGTVAVIEGPRFSTRAESLALRAAGADLVNMTLLPEVALAAELGIGSVCVCVVTDMDAGFAPDDPGAVTAEAVYERFARALPDVVAGIERIVAGIQPGYRPRALLSEDARREVLDRAAAE